MTRIPGRFASCLDSAALRERLDRGDDVVLLQTGFGAGHAFLHAWQTWRDCAARAGRLHFIGITADPPSAQALRDSHSGTPLWSLAAQLADGWPVLTPDLHCLDFEDGRVSLLLAIGTAATWLPQLRAEVQLFVIDEFDASANPQGWALRLVKALARLAGRDAGLRARLPHDEIAAALRSSGFVLAPSAAAGVTQARYAPAFEPRGRPVRPAPRSDALIVGAGLAGCATARALAQLGWTSTMVDRHDQVAAEASGNFAGLFHGIVNPQDGSHARFNRAAALHTRRLLQTAAHDGAVQCGLQGLLRVQGQGIGVHAMREQLARLQLPEGYVQALDAQQASRLCGVELQQPAWYFPGGGWLRPALLARFFLRQAAGRVRLHEAVEVASIRRDGGLWHLLDAHGASIAHSAVLVLAGAYDSLRLAGCTHWPVQRVRGQLSLYARSSRSAAAPAPHTPLIPLTGAGYVLPEIDGTMVFGASAQPDDDDEQVRAADHVMNLQRLQSLCPQPLAPPLRELTGQVAWRCVSDDRLPIIGAAPDESSADAAAFARLRNAPRHEGLYLFTALASRGITWAALGARLLAAQVNGTPWPLAESLAESVDPARFMQRRLRRRD